MAASTFAIAACRNGVSFSLLIHVEFAPNAHTTLYNRSDGELKSASFSSLSES